MPQPDRILLVVSILEGRNFPSQPSSQLTVDAKFDGEILTTDPVDFTSTPDINQELAWELDKKTFQQHKLQRSVIKCNAYATALSGQRESLGYFMIDIRPLNTAQKIRWHHLLQTKYPKLKSEFSICAYIEDDQSTRSASATSKTSKTPSTTGISSASSASRSKHLQPVLLEDKGYYQLGADVSSAEIFGLSITIRSAKNLIHLLPSSTALNTQHGYCFYYSLFGNKVTTEQFHDLIQPQFYPERASVRIRSSIQLLRSYFETMRPIEFSLRSGNDIIGQTHIPLHKIVKPLQQKSGMERSFDELTEEFHLRLAPSSGNEKIKPSEDENSQATVKVEIKLSREIPISEQKPNNDKQQRLKSNSANQNLTSNTSVVDNELSISQHVQQISINNHATTDDHVSSPIFHGTSDQHLSHHYCLSIDLKSLRNLRLSHSTYLYCRYVYPFLGTSTPILTHPPLHMPYTSSTPPNEHLLPHGLCIFNFAVDTEQLTSHFHREPLTVEVYCRDQDRSERKDELFGLVRLQLDSVLKVEKQRCSSNVNGILGWRQTWTQTLPVIGANTEKSGELLVTVILEDLGTLHLNSSTTSRPPSVPPHNLHLDAVFQRPHDDAHLQAAYELQLWKESKELEFEKHLREVEAKKLYELMEAFKEKDRERESLLQKKMKEYGELEKQMKKALTDIEKREKHLNVKEQEIQRMQVDLKRDYDNKYIEIREASKRLQEQSEHHITLEKSKNQALDDEIIRLKRSVAEWEKRYREKEQDFFSYKEKQRSAPEIKLQSEINMLTLEKNELQRKLDASVISGERYKQQWLKALKEYQRLKQREQDQSKFQLQKQQQELEHMRLRYLAAEESEIMKSDHKQLENIKNELNKLKEVSSTPTVTGTLQSHVSDDNDHLEQVDQQLGVLIEHRDTLLQTGTYSHNDALIQELERRIQEAMKRKSSGSRYQ
ncbi:unnamed protein product [Rotaria socialis]|uniref:C2 domain-containing protein n=7 Tax=Rotaria socialis TaxID=392032 RepID=A0A818CXC8_9BILA|nr:unnamed protein product [Rotaria socialis]CAF3485449.1 unnamed protein product [Rotaria socialis]CAF3486968.1 unnamed protein product [Rotaria socialis]CAF3577002.1 unnamed protein product [Rotaria socialis]CAF3724161.1 unnamed protein product [Rotaria socialis]